MSDPLGPLRKFDFPRCAAAGLERMCTLFAQSDSGIPGLGGQSDDLAEQITREFVFCEPHGRVRGIRNFTALQELQLLEVMAKFFSNPKHPASVHQTVFHSLFSNSFENRRRAIFYKLVSLAVGVKCTGFLDCVAQWMQRQGCHTDSVLHLAELLVQDYCELVPSAESSLRHLPSMSQHFTSNFITAVTHIYSPFGESNHQKVLPHGMLELLTSWLQADSRLCLASLGHGSGGITAAPQRSSLWTSPTKPNHQTPVPGLVRWSTQAPLLALLRAHPGLDTEHIMWSQLHLHLLQTLTTFPSLHGASQLELLTLADMNRIVHETGSLIKETQVSEKLREREEARSAAVNTALERLVQLLQVSMATGGFRCSLSDLQNICNSVPSNRLLEILQSQHLTQAPQPMHFESR